VLALSLVASHSAARPTDDSEAFARLISTDALTLDLLDVLGQSSGNRTGAGATYGEIYLALLQGLFGLDLDLGDGLVLPLLGEAGTSVLDLGPLAGAGVLGAYAASPDATTSVAATGTVTDDGTVDLSPVANPGDTALARLDLTALLGQLRVGGLTDLLGDEVSVGLGAIAARAEATGTGTYVPQYTVAGAELRVGSPAVARLSTDLATAYNGLDATLEGVVNGALGSEGVLGQLIGALELIKLDLNIGLSLLKVGIDDATVGVTVALPDLDDILLATAVSSEGLVTIDLSTGTIAVDLPKLVKAPDAQDLNGLAPNTSVLTDDTIERIVAGVASALGQLVDTLNAEIRETLARSSVVINLDGGISAIGISATDLDVTITGTLAQLTGADPTRPTIKIGADLLGIPLGSLVNALATPLLDIVL